MINWNEVIVGETEIVSRADEPWLVACRHRGKVWLLRDGVNQIRDEKTLDKWTIDDPWVDVSNQCHINAYGNIDHNGHIIDYNDLASGRYKRSEKGLRVWRRKEG